MLARDSTKYTGICIGPIIIFRLAEKTRIIPKSLNFLKNQRTYIFCQIYCCGEFFKKLAHPMKRKSDRKLCDHQVYIKRGN